MSALAASVSSSWIPEDDLLLKNAIESGASLEALAKGAVRFSRKFTVRELQDRWRALLYDPVISEQASGRMIEVELSTSSLSSKSSKFDNLVENGSTKRKLESVRNLYYAMRKRTCNRLLTDSSNISFLGSPNGNYCIEPVGPVKGKKACASGYDFVPSELMLTDGYDIGSSAAISRGDLAETDALLNFDGETMDRSCYDSVNSLLLNSPNDIHEDDTSKTKEPGTLVSDNCPGTSDAVCPAKLDEIPDQQSHSGNGEQLGVSCPEINLPACTLESNPHPPELHDEVICCTLNSEDPEIPCNDDILLGEALDLSAIQKCHKLGSDQASFAKGKDDKEELSLIDTEDSLTHCFTGPKMVAVDHFSKSTQGVKSGFHDGPCHVISRQAQMSLVDPSSFKAAQNFPNSASDVAAKKEPSDECNTKDMPMHETSSILDTVLEPGANPATSDRIDYESDDNVPSFSDVEAMILEMDLCPDESDSLVSREVLRYQDEHAKRTIIRLEQCARSAMQRAIASRGALAVFYGHRMKHYIKETEVILGRATMDVDVDIDLGREGCANKISRRQALIKMEDNGSFSLKNLGKSSIFLNGKEVSTGQQMDLGLSSLIEIRDMAFVFETNQKSVKRYMARISQKNQEKKTTFEWSEEPKRV